MKQFKNTIIISREEQNDREDKAFNKGIKYGEKASKERIENLENALAKKDKALGKLQTQYDDYVESSDAQAKKYEAKIDVLESDRDDVREVVKKSMENEDTAAVLAAKEELIAKREETLAEREEALEDKEEKNYKSGYADGSADMARKINEITQKDRDNAMKVALVSASSHTPVENMKEINRNVKSLTTGTTDEES